MLPGGVANPDILHTCPPPCGRPGMFEAGNPPRPLPRPWTLVEADLVRGRTLTSWPSLRTDIQNAGGTWVDAEVQVDRSGPNVLITSRNPGDLPPLPDPGRGNRPPVPVRLNPGFHRAVSLRSSVTANSPR